MQNQDEPIPVKIVIRRQEITCPVCSNIMSSLLGDHRNITINCDKCGQSLKTSNDLEFE